jgi:toxin ParE1/3/4
MNQTKSVLYRVTPRAKEDLINIAHYTDASWGRAQRNLYLKQLEQRFAWLANPHLGKARSEIADGFYSFPQGQHIIFYLISGRFIDVIGIPHQEMDIDGYFKN